MSKFFMDRKLKTGQKRSAAKAFHYNRIASDRYPPKDRTGHPVASTRPADFAKVCITFQETHPRFSSGGFSDLLTLISLLAFEEPVNNSLTNKGKTRYTMMFVLTGMTP